MPEKFFKDYRFTVDATKRLDYDRLPLCEHGEDYLVWVSEQFPDLFEEPDAPTLDQALLTMAKEYGYRRQTVVPHGFNSCLREVFEELLDMIIDKQWELHRHPMQKGAGTLHIGDADDE